MFIPFSIQFPISFSIQIISSSHQFIPLPAQHLNAFPMEGQWIEMGGRGERGRIGISDIAGSGGLRYAAFMR
jgi:hypothetical protein